MKFKKKDFSFAFKNRLVPGSIVFYRGLYMSLYAVREREPKEFLCTIRVGLVVSKKTGKATKRNKIRRRLRALTKASMLSRSSTGYYYIIVAHANIMQASYKNLQKDLAVYLKKNKVKGLN